MWDNGEGIAETKQAQIFNEFTRLESDVMEGGLGLGLAIAKGICRVLDHDLVLRSWQNRGTVFAIVLPLGVAKGVCPLTPPHSLGGLSILCVANAAVWTKNLQQWGQDWGAKVAVASPDCLNFDALTDSLPKVVIFDQKSVPKNTQTRLIDWAKSHKVALVAVGRTPLDHHKTLAYWGLPLKPLKVRLWLQQHAI